MQKSFSIKCDIGTIEMPAENEEEAIEKAKKAVPEIKEITSVQEMSEIEIAKLEIDTLKAQIYAMGANDYEMPTIANILVSLREGKITPREAVDRVRKIKDSKQDYH